jgi:hypothetical protein
MIEVFSHLFVWIASPAAVLSVAGYAIYKREFILGALASAAALLGCAGIAMQLFDNHLLIYQLIYAALAVVPSVMGIVAVLSFLYRSVKFLTDRIRPKVSA